MKNVTEAFLRQFKDFTVIMLLVLAVFGGVCGSIAGFGGLGDSLIVLAIVFVNAGFGAFQELKADRVLGKTAGERPTPLQKELGEVGQGLCIITIGLCVVVFLGSLLRGAELGGALFLAVSLAVAVVPESLPAVVNVVLSVGVMRLAKQGTIVRRLSSAESMGQAESVFLDLDKIDERNKIALRKAGIKLFDRTNSRVFYELWGRDEIIGFVGEDEKDERFINASDVGCCFRENEHMYKYSHMIFESPSAIWAAVKTGREIFDNLEKALHFLLSCNAGEILCVFGALVLGIESPLLGVQLLLVNLITDCLPAIAFGLEPERADIMDKAPEKRSGIFNLGFVVKILFEGLIIGGVSLCAFIFGRAYGGVATGRAMAFCVICLSQLFHGFNFRENGFLKNKFLNLAFVIGVLAVVFAVQIPFLASLLGFCPLEVKICFDVILLSVLPFVTFEIIKRI